ncbi:MAG: TRAP transporter large permease [Hyphomicrobiaceae bacterium]|nr:TRAP transporter large permease [Hyphomicrobiaceae bacterium]
MELLTVGYICIGALFVLLFAGIPVGIAMAVVGVGGMYFGVGPDFMLGQLRSLPYAVTSNYAYAILPLFVVMGIFAELAGLTESIFRAADIWLRRVRGGLYQAVVVGSAIFAAVSGSTIVNAVVFTRIAFPEMMKYGYNRSLSIGSIAASGSFAAMIPPSITMVIYAIITEQSIGRLLIAGIVPGILTAIVYILGIAVIVRVRPELAPIQKTAPDWVERLAALRWLWGVVVLIGVVLGGIYTGAFPPSAAGAIGAAGAFLFVIARLRGRLFKRLWPALGDAASISCVIFLILIGGLIFSRMLVVSGVIDQFVTVVTSLAGSPLGFLVLASLLYFVLGCFLDTTSMMIVTLPFVFPAVVHFNIDPIWFGIILVKLVEISVVTPPVGMNLFAVLGAVDAETNFGHVVRGVTPFILLEIIVLALLIAFPELSLWLPRQMM